MLNNKVMYQDKDVYIFNCPHCNDIVTVNKNEINCCIFRHAVYKKGKQVNPHLSKEKCDKLINENKIYGCCKPFRFIYKKDGKHYVEKCDYI